MSTTFTTVVTDSCRTATLRRVFVTFPHVAPPGVDWFSDHGGRHFELTSFKGGPVEVYVQHTDGLFIYQGSVRDLAEPFTPAGWVVSRRTSHGSASSLRNRIGARSARVCAHVVGRHDVVGHHPQEAATRSDRMLGGAAQAGLWQTRCGSACRRLSPLRNELIGAS